MDRTAVVRSSEPSLIGGKGLISLKTFFLSLFWFQTRTVRHQKKKTLVNYIFFPFTKEKKKEEGKQQKKKRG